MQNSIITLSNTNNMNANNTIDGMSMKDIMNQLEEIQFANEALNNELLNEIDMTAMFKQVKEPDALNASSVKDLYEQINWNEVTEAEKANESLRSELLNDVDLNTILSEVEELRGATPIRVIKQFA